MNTVTSFPTWKTITLGDCKTAYNYCKALKFAGCDVGNWSNDIMGQSAFTVENVQGDADLVLVTVADLGFRDGATLADIYNKAEELGLELCPPQVGPALRLQYKDQPYGEWIVIAMDPIIDSVGYRNLFFVVHDDGGLRLDTGYDCLDDRWLGYYQFVFLRRK